MGKINITVPHTVVQGERISFKTPCSSANTTGLNINNVAYTAVNANTENIAGITGLWASGVILSAVLDVTNKKAYIINI